MKRDRLKYLFSQYFQNNISRIEFSELLKAVDCIESEIIEDVIEEIISEKPDLLAQSPNTFNQESVYHKISTQITQERQYNHKKISKLLLLAAAAVLLVFSLFTVRFYLTTAHADSEIVADIKLPEQNQAFIQYSDGVSYLLSNMSSDSLIKRGITRITKDNGELCFQIAATATTKDLQQTFYTPKGSSAQLILSDGTKVWLNSGSNMSYPTNFDSKERLVSLSGEAYFDVSHQAQQPFIVEAKNSRIKVLGTEFNISTNLNPGKVITTLIEGSVEVKTSQARTVLKPGLQAESSNSSGELRTQEIDIKDITAWKHGYFRFKDDDIYQVLHKIMAWYNIQDYEIQELTKDRFTGSILRTRKLSDILNQLEKISNYKFTIKDGRIIVMK